MSGGRQHAEEAAPPAPAPAPAGESAALAAPALTPAGLLRLQVSAGNQAVARRLMARQPAVAPTGPPAAPAPAADVPGRPRQLDPPAPTRGVPAGPAPAGDDAVRPAVDVAADARNVTVTVVLRNFNFPASGDASTVDFLHEPGVSIQVTPGTPDTVVQAAIAAINVHLRLHGRELVELSLSPQGSVDSGGRPSAGLQGQLELHVTTSFSMTAATSVAVTPHSETPDEGSVPLPSPDRSVDLRWSPFSVGVLFHLDPQRRPDPGQPLDYDALRSDAALIRWVVNQLDRGDFASRGAGQLEVDEFVTQLLDAMRSAGSGEAPWAIHLGVLQVAEIPAGLTRGLTRAAQLIAGANRAAAGVTQVRVSMFNLPPSGEGAERVVRWALLPVAGQAVAPPAP